MKSLRASFLVLAFLLIGCDTLNETPDNALLRVENQSQTNFTNVRVQFMAEPKDYGAVKAGTFSAYRTFETAYRYGLVEAQTADTTYRLQPIDFVGESPLQAGRYTYRLTLEDAQLGLEFVEDGS